MRHLRQVEGDFAAAVERHLAGADPLPRGTDERMRVTVTARCVATAVFGAMEVSMLGVDRSLQLRGVGDDPVIYDPVIYDTDPMKLLTHLNEVHGAEAVNGMAGLMAGCQAPTRALGRFDAAQPSGPQGSQGVTEASR